MPAGGGSLHMAGHPHYPVLLKYEVSEVEEGISTLLGIPWLLTSADQAVRHQDHHLYTPAFISLVGDEGGDQLFRLLPGGAR